MAESNKINTVLIDGELADVSIDADTGLYTHGEPEIDMEREIEDQMEKEETNKRRKWFGAGKRKDEADAGTKERDAESGRSKEEVGDDSDDKDDKSVFGNFAASLLNVCTFGLFSSSSSSSPPKEPDEKFLSVIVESERESYQLESEQSEGRTRTMTTRDRDLVSEFSIASDGIDNNSADPMLARSYKETRVKTALKTVLCHSCMVLIFLVMAVLFIIGGILWKRNGF